VVKINKSSHTDDSQSSSEETVKTHKMTNSSV